MGRVSTILIQSRRVPTAMNGCAGCIAVGTRRLGHGASLDAISIGGEAAFRRGVGPLLGVELVRDRATRERATDEAEQVMYAALTRGLSFKLTMGNIITLTPPLTITAEQMDAALDILDKSIAEASRGR